MPLPFDATLKDLVRQYTTAYERALHLGGKRPARVLNVDLSTVSAATDIVLAHGDPLEHITDLNFQSGPDAFLDERLLLYHVLLRHEFHVPVHSVAVLLRPAADWHAGIGSSGRLKYHVHRLRGKMDFTFEIVRLW